MGSQTIVAISREFGSGGHEIAAKIAKDLGLGFYDRNMLDEIAEKKNIKIEYLEKYDEKPGRRILSRRVGEYTNSLEEILADMQFEYLRKKADTGESFVIVGRCAETVLRDRAGLISIFVLGDKKAKLERVKKEYQLDERAALSKMRRHDRTRKRYHDRHSEYKWGDSRNYDLCINSSRMGVAQTAQLLEVYIKERMSR